MKRPRPIASFDAVTVFCLHCGLQGRSAGEFFRWPELPMPCCFLLISFALMSCVPFPSYASDDLPRMWTARTNSAQEIAAAVNARFTNGTPMREVESVLGRPSEIRMTTTASDPTETQNRRTWVYHGFRSGPIFILSSGEPATPVRERRFAGARVVGGPKLTPLMSDDQILRSLNLDPKKLSARVTQGKDGQSTEYCAGTDRVVITRSIDSGLSVTHGMQSWYLGKP